MQTLGQLMVETIKEQAPEFLPSPKLHDYATEDLNKHLVQRGIPEELVRKVIVAVFGDKTRCRRALQSKVLKNKDRPHWVIIKAWNDLQSHLDEWQKPSAPDAPQGKTGEEKKSMRQFYAEQGRPGSPYERFGELLPSDKLALEIDWLGSVEEKEVQSRRIASEIPF